MATNPEKTGTRNTERNTNRFAGKRKLNHLFSSPEKTERLPQKSDVRIQDSDF